MSEGILTTVSVKQLRPLLYLDTTGISIYNRPASRPGYHSDGWLYDKEKAPWWLHKALHHQWEYLIPQAALGKAFPLPVLLWQCPMLAANTADKWTTIIFWNSASASAPGPQGPDIRYTPCHFCTLLHSSRPSTLYLLARTSSSWPGTEQLAPWAASDRKTVFHYKDQGQGSMACCSNKRLGWWCIRFSFGVQQARQRACLTSVCLLVPCVLGYASCTHHGHKEAHGMVFSCILQWRQEMRCRPASPKTTALAAALKLPDIELYTLQASLHVAVCHRQRSTNQRSRRSRQTSTHLQMHQPWCPTSPAIIFIQGSTPLSICSTGATVRSGCDS